MPPVRNRSPAAYHRSPSSARTLPHRPRGSTGCPGRLSASVVAALKLATAPGSSWGPPCPHIRHRRAHCPNGRMSPPAPALARVAMVEPPLNRYRYSSRQASLEPFRGVVSHPPCPRGPPVAGAPLQHRHHSYSCAHDALKNACFLHRTMRCWERERDRAAPYGHRDGTRLVH